VIFGRILDMTRLRVSRLGKSVRGMTITGTCEALDALLDVHLRMAATDDDELKAVATALRAYGDDLEAMCRLAVREGIDEVVDGRRYRRHSYDSLQELEKRFCGARIESALIRSLDLQRGKRLDCRIMGIEVDIKCSGSTSWMVGKRQVGDLVLLVTYSEKARKFSVGLIRASSDDLNPGANQDKKRSFSKRGKLKALWLVEDAHLPVSILRDLSDAEFRKLLLLAGRERRVARFVELIREEVPFSRSVIETVVGGDDPLRGTRRDTNKFGDTHPLGNFRLVPADKNRKLADSGLPTLASREWMKVDIAKHPSLD